MATVAASRYAALRSKSTWEPGTRSPSRKGPLDTRPSLGTSLRRGEAAGCASSAGNHGKGAARRISSWSSATTETPISAGAARPASASAMPSMERKSAPCGEARVGSPSAWKVVTKSAATTGRPSDHRAAGSISKRQASASADSVQRRAAPGTGTPAASSDTSPSCRSRMILSAGSLRAYRGSSDSGSALLPRTNSIGRSLDAALSLSGAGCSANHAPPANPASASNTPRTPPRRNSVTSVCDVDRQVARIVAREHVGREPRHPWLDEYFSDRVIDRQNGILREHTSLGFLQQG